MTNLNKICKIYDVAQYIKIKKLGKKRNEFRYFYIWKSKFVKKNHAIFYLSVDKKNRDLFQILESRSIHSIYADFKSYLMLHLSFEIIVV